MNNLMGLDISIPYARWFGKSQLQTSAGFRIAAQYTSF
jgi:hypothetical protein